MNTATNKSNIPLGENRNSNLTPLYVRARAFWGTLMPVVAKVKTDWFRVINDITRSGIPLQEIARELDVSKSAIIGWKQGAAPNHHTGEALIDFWCYVTKRQRTELPVQVSSRRFVYAWRNRHA